MGLDGAWGSKLGWKLSAERKSKGELILFWTIGITQDALEPVVEPPALYSRARISLFCFQYRGYFPHILTPCFLPLKDELLQVLIFILGQNIAKQHSQSNDINGKREKLSDSSWAGSGRLTAMERTLHRQHWQSLCHTELQLGLCKSLAVLTKHPNSGSVPAPSESQISCCPSRDGVKPELCLQESHEPAEARHHGELAAPGDFQGREGPGMAFRHRRFPHSLQAGGTIRTCHCFPSHPAPQSPSGEGNPAPHTPSSLCKAPRAQGGIWGCLRPAAPADLWGRENAPILPGTSPQSTPIKCKLLNYSQSCPCILPPSAHWVLFSSRQIIRHKG